MIKDDDDDDDKSKVSFSRQQAYGQRCRVSWFSLVMQTFLFLAKSPWIHHASSVLVEIWPLSSSNMHLNKNISRLGRSELLENVELLFNNVSKNLNMVELFKTSFFIELPPPLPLAHHCLHRPAFGVAQKDSLAGKSKWQATDTFCMILLHCSM